MACPKCAEHSGFPYKASTIRDEPNLELSMRCHRCRHEWTAYFDQITHVVGKPVVHHSPVSHSR